MLFGEILSGEVPEQDILLFPVVGPVSIGTDEIDGGVDEGNIYRVSLPHAQDLAVEYSYHPFDGPVLPHQRSYRFHSHISCHRIHHS